MKIKTKGLFSAFDLKKMNNRFFFKKFAISHHNCGMPVSTDGVLLGSWAQAEKASTLLDIGTGTGLLALMMAQRFSESKIVAIDINEQAVFAAQENVAQSPWQHRISVLQADIQSWKNSEKFDLIICNPPYFNTGERSVNANRALARHTNNLSHAALIQAIKQKLNNDGSAHLILPKLEAEQFISKAKMQGLFCSRLTEVKTTQYKPVSRILFTLCHQVCQTQVQQLVIQENGTYSQDFINLTKNFYLKM